MEEEYNRVSARLAFARLNMGTQTDLPNATFKLVAAREAAKHKHAHCVMMLVDKMKVMRLPV